MPERGGTLAGAAAPAVAVAPSGVAAAAVVEAAGRAERPLVPATMRARGLLADPESEPPDDLPAFSVARANSCKP